MSSIDCPPQPASQHTTQRRSRSVSHPRSVSGDSSTTATSSSSINVVILTNLNLLRCAFHFAARDVKHAIRLRDVHSSWAETVECHDGASVVLAALPRAKLQKLIANDKSTDEDNLRITKMIRASVWCLRKLDARTWQERYLRLSAETLRDEDWFALEVPDRLAELLCEAELSDPGIL